MRRIDVTNARRRCGLGLDRDRLDRLDERKHGVRVVADLLAV